MWMISYQNILGKEKRKYKQKENGGRNDEFVFMMKMVIKRTLFTLYVYIDINKCMSVD